MTTRTLSFLFSTAALSFGFLSAVNCGPDNTTSTSTSTNTGNSSSSASSSSSSSGDGGSGGGSTGCIQDSDCKEPNSVCEKSVCIQATCVNGMKDGNESDVDCGGGCLPCANDKACAAANDCESMFCNAMKCAACLTDVDCAAVPDSYCSAGACAVKKANAMACASDAECQSGFCPTQDGICCNERCDNTCEACAGTKTGGADGTCGPVSVDMDPDNECTDMGVASCGSNATGCNGNKSTPGCKVYDNTTVCAAAGCAGGEAKTDSLCDGNGKCVAATATSCAPYACDANGTACATSCTTNNDCDAAHFCDTASSTCVAKKNNGATCASGAQCASGFCPTQDGVCCDTACDTLCRACVQAKTGAASGTCGNVTGGTDPDNECSQVLMPNCDGAGKCGL